MDLCASHTATKSKSEINLVTSVRVTLISVTSFSNLCEFTILENLWSLMSCAIHLYRQRENVHTENLLVQVQIFSINLTSWKKI